MFFKSDVFKECGYFDEKIFMYLEEFDISNRLIYNGYHTIYCAQYSFLHKVGNRRKINKRHGSASLILIVIYVANMELIKKIFFIQTTIQTTNISFITFKLQTNKRSYCNYKNKEANI